MHYAEIARHVSRKILIDGVLATTDEALAYQPVINPANMSQIAEICLCSAHDVDLALRKADDAFLSWKKTTNKQRGQYLAECAKTIREHKDELALLMSYETGKAIRTESRLELEVVIETFEFYAGLALEIKGETVPFNHNSLNFTVREPLGVVAAIIPWNVPLLIMSMKIVPALIAGNTVVVKPSPEASLCALYLAELVNQVLPKNVLNIVTGGAAAGHELIAHRIVKKVSFTGSVESGRKVYQAAAHKIVPVTLELGGKSPLVICDDADLDKAVLCAYDAMRFTRQGQSCSAASRIFVHEMVIEAFLTKLLNYIDQKVIGDPLEESTDIGSLISKKQYDKILSFVSLANECPDLRIRYAGNMVLTENISQGLFLKPTIISGIQNDHEICQKEIFGPVAAVISFSKFEDVVKEANTSEFGLAAGIFTTDISRALKFALDIDAGFVQVNQYKVFKPSLAFGGFKNSGIGKESSLRAMIDHYTREKMVIINYDE